MSMRLLLCAPHYYRVAYVINPWMEGNVDRTDNAKATRQWAALRAILAARVSLEVVDAVPGLPDMVFAANGGLVVADTFVPARFRVAQRRAEAAHFTTWFRRRGLRIVELAESASFEGEGDALMQPGEPLLWGGYGMRTTLDAHHQLAEIFDQLEVIPLRLVDARFYHLDTCFCPLPSGRVMYYPAAFDTDSLERIAARIPPQRRIEVSADDAFAFACNAIVVGNTLITNRASAALVAHLHACGHEVIDAPLSEFLMAGGAAKCLALHVDRYPR